MKKISIKNIYYVMIYSFICLFLFLSCDISAAVSDIGNFDEITNSLTYFYPYVIIINVDNEPIEGISVALVDKNNKYISSSVSSSSGKAYFSGFPRDCEYVGYMYVFDSEVYTFAPIKFEVNISFTEQFLGYIVEGTILPEVEYMPIIIQ